MPIPGAAGIAALAIGCVLAGCAGSGDDGEDGGPPPPTCRPPEVQTFCFATNIQPIFDGSCAVAGGCHLPPQVNEELDLSAGRSYGNTVGVRSRQQPRLQRVRPGQPEASYLWLKIEDAPGISGDIMPSGCRDGTPTAGECLTPDQKEAIRIWIAECALEDGCAQGN